MGSSNVRYSSIADGAGAPGVGFIARHKLALSIAGLSAVAGAVAAGVLLSQSAAAPAAAIPEQIMLSPGLDLTQMQVAWTIPYGEVYEGVPSYPPSQPPPIVTNGVMPVHPRVEYGLTSPNELIYNASAAWSNYTYQDETSNYTSAQLMNATMTGLVPGATFYYRVGDDANGFSPVMTATALPPPGTLGVRIGLIGDLGTTNNSVDTIAHMLANHAAAPLTASLLVGDLSYADGTQPVWNSFGHVISPAASVLPFLWGLGNHEWFDFEDYSFVSYTKRMRIPAAVQGDATRLWYSYDIGLVHFVMLQGYCPQMRSTATQPCLAAGTEQRAWLQADLAAVNRALTPFVVVTFHQPYVNSNTAHSISKEGLPMQQAIEDLLVAGGVDLTISGHVHAYERSCRQYNYTCTQNASHPYSLTIGDGGNRENLALSWVQPQPQWSLYRQASYGHGILTATNATHMLVEWHQNPDLAPTIADSFWVIKGDGGPVGPGKTGVPHLVNRRLRAA